MNEQGIVELLDVIGERCVMKKKVVKKRTKSVPRKSLIQIYMMAEEMSHSNEYGMGDEHGYIGPRLEVLRDLKRVRKWLGIKEGAVTKIKLTKRNEMKDHLYRCDRCGEERWYTCRLPEHMLEGHLPEQFLLHFGRRCRGKLVWVEERLSYPDVT